MNVRQQLRKPNRRILTAILVLQISLVFLIVAPSYATNNNQSINIEVSTYLGDKQKFKAGDKIAFLVSLDNDAHLLMVYEDAQHNLIQIIPNPYRKNSLYKEGLFIAVPDSKEPFEFLINPPFGEEKLWVFASSKPFPEISGTTLENGLRKLDVKLADMLTTVRPKSKKVLYGESSTVITTEP